MRLRAGHLRYLRQRRMLTQQELADQAGTTESTVNRLENGLQQPRISTVRKLAIVLGVDAEELIVWPNEAETGKRRPNLAGTPLPRKPSTRQVNVGQE